MVARPFRKLFAVALVTAIAATVSAAQGDDPPDVRGGRGDSRKGSDGPGFDGQIEVPAAFSRGSAFLLTAKDDCRILFPRWTGMARDTRNVMEKAGGVETPTFPIACARSGSQLTCKIFKSGFTVAFNATVKADTSTQLSFGTSAGYISTVIDLQKRTATFKQTAPSGNATVCEATYKSREEATEDVAKLDPAPSAPLPPKDRANGTNSSADRLTCRSRHESLGPKDPVTGRQAPICSACTDACGFVGEECHSGTCAYTGKGDTRGDDAPSSSPSAPGSKKPTAKGIGDKCAHDADCASKICGTISSPGGNHKCGTKH